MSQEQTKEGTHLVDRLQPTSPPSCTFWRRPVRHGPCDLFDRDAHKVCLRLAAHEAGGRSREVDEKNDDIL
jgi:hypothetical protein